MKMMFQYKCIKSVRYILDLLKCWLKSRSQQNMMFGHWEFLLIKWYVMELCLFTRKIEILQNWSRWLKMGVIQYPKQLKLLLTVWNLSMIVWELTKKKDYLVKNWKSILSWLKNLSMNSYLMTFQRNSQETKWTSTL